MDKPRKFCDWDTIVNLKQSPSIRLSMFHKFFCSLSGRTRVNMMANNWQVSSPIKFEQGPSLHGSPEKQKRYLSLDLRLFNKQKRNIDKK